MSFQAEYHDHMKRALHNRDVEIRKLQRQIARATRTVRATAATLTMERARMREASDTLRGLCKFADRPEAIPSPGFLAMSARVAIRTLGEEP